MAAMRLLPNPRAFSLLEVVVAVGIFALAMVAVIGLFTPVTKAVTDSDDAETAARVVDAVLIHLQGQPFAAVAGFLKTNETLAADDQRSDYNPADPAEAKIFFADVTGEKIGRTGDAVWAGSDREKFFEVALVRNEILSPEASDATAPLLAFNLRIRWPAFLPAAGGAAIQPGANSTASVRFDHSHKHVLFFSGSVLR